MSPRQESQTSLNLRTLMDLGYIMERVEDSRRGIILRGRRGPLLLTAVAPNDELASADLLAQARARADSKF
jgi:hypothetical protein